LASIGLVVIVLAAVLIGRTLGGGRSVTPVPPLAGLVIDRDAAAAHLAEYIRIDTSTPPGIPQGGASPYLKLLIDRYATPLGLEHQIIDDRILLLRWRAPRSGERPLVLLSHVDVVPVADEERPRWRHAPFAGEIAEGFVW